RGCDQRIHSRAERRDDCDSGHLYGGLPSTDHRPGGRVPCAGSLWLPVLREGRRACVLWPGSSRPISGGGRICRPHPQVPEASRSSGASADQIRADYQSQDRQGARPRRALAIAAARRRGDRMRRREFIALVGGLATAPLVAKAQQAEKLYRIGILSPERPPPELLEAFQQGLRELGYVEGKNVAFEIRASEGYGQELAALASQLVGLKVDVILAVNTPGALTARNATTTIPIVITRVADPLESGLVSSLSRPGGNITGLSFMSTDISGKRLALLKEMLPSVSRVAALWDQRNPGASMIVDAMKAPSRRLGLELLLLPIQGPSDLIGAFQTAKSGRVEALTVVDDVVITSHRIEILSL